MELIRYNTLEEKPWKNGLGTTREIVIWPLDADLSNFEWRVSAASIIFPGHFSHYPEVSRSLGVLSGKSAELKLGETTKTLSYKGEILRFDGGEHAEVLSANGPVLDYNVMSRDKAVTHELNYVSLSKKALYTRRGDFTLVTVFNACELIVAGNIVPMAEFDSVLFKERDAIEFSFENDQDKVDMLVTEIWNEV